MHFARQATKGGQFCPPFLFIKEITFIFGNSCTVAVAVNFNVLIFQKFLYREKHDSECDCVYNNTEIYPYAEDISEHSAEDNADADNGDDLKLVLVRVKG